MCDVANGLVGTDTIYTMADEERNGTEHGGAVVNERLELEQHSPWHALDGAVIGDR